MPVVRSYFRRSPGAAIGTTRSGGRRLDVAVYNAATGTTLLRGWNRESVEDLQFATGLPGGFLDAAFTLRAPAPKLWPVDTGQKVIIRLGNQIVWWGWVEDVRRRQRGRTEEMGVTCLGPWQTLSQRRIPAVAYTSVYPGDTALKVGLAAYGTYVSSDYSQIMSTGVDLGDLTKSNWKVAELVKMICEAGDNSNRPVLFALWEPGTKQDYIRSTNVITNPDFEQGTTAPSGWSKETGSDMTFSWSTTYYNSAIHAPRWVNITGDNSLYQDNVPCSASTNYLLEYSLRRDAATWGQAHVEIIWKKANGDTISTWVGPVLDTESPTGTWTDWKHEVASPALAAKFRIDLFWVAGTDSRYVAWDDVYVSLAGTSAASDNLPRAHLWARDLTLYDYVIHTERLATGLDVRESTRDLANAVLASYGATPSYTAYAENGTSQTAYRRRDYLVEAGEAAGAAVAASMRDTYLAAYKNPLDEPGSFTLITPGALTGKYGDVTELPLLRAGDRLKVADGVYAGRIFMIAATNWSEGGLQISPEGELSTSALLARVE